VTLPRNDLEALVASAWLAVTGSRPDSVFADFFLTGGTSVQAVELVALIRRRLGGEVSLRLIFDRPTVAEFAAALADPETDERYAFELCDGPESPLLLAPSAAGSSGWISAVADSRAGRPVIGLSSRRVRPDSPAQSDVDSIARHLLQAAAEAGVTGPAHLLGSCVGGRFALEMARRAGDFGITALSVTLINTSLQTEQMPYRERVRSRINDVRRRTGLAAVPGPLTDDEAALEVERLFKETDGSHLIAESTLQEFTGRVEIFAANWAAVAHQAPEACDVPIHLLYNPQETDDIDPEGWAAVFARSTREVEIAPVLGLTLDLSDRPDVVARVYDFLRRVEAREPSGTGPEPVDA
jgi:pimeloyl-ACP methyl ester carboxylesterase